MISVPGRGRSRRAREMGIALALAKGNLGEEDDEGNGEG
jgi:hypothetical protein